MGETLEDRVACDMARDSTETGVLGESFALLDSSALRKKSDFASTRSDVGVWGGNEVARESSGVTAAADACRR